MTRCETCGRHLSPLPYDHPIQCAALASLAKANAPEPVPAIQPFVQPVPIRIRLDPFADPLADRLLVGELVTGAGRIAC